MKQRRRRYFTDSELNLAWDRWQKGESLNSIARDLDRGHSAIQRVFARTGGIRPPQRSRSQVALSLAERIVPLYFSGRYDEAVELYEATRELDLLPVYHGPQAAVLAGNNESGFRLWIDLLQAHDIKIDDPSMPLQQIAAGDVSMAYDWLAAQLPENPASKNAALIRASWLITSGYQDEAMEVLLAGAQKVFDGPGPSSVPTFLWAVFPHDPIFSELKSDPRMAEVLDLVGVAPTVKAARAQIVPGGTMPSSAKARN